MLINKYTETKVQVGVDGIPIEHLAYHLRKNKDDIRNQIRKRKYKPMPVLRVEIPKDNGKTRKLGIPTVVDRVMKSVTDFIEKKLGLIVNAEKSRISRPGNIKFLGFGFYYDTRTKKYQPRAHQESVHKFQRKLKQLTKRSQGISLNNRIIKLRQVIYGWVNYFKIAKMKSILTNIDAKLRSEYELLFGSSGKTTKRELNHSFNSAFRKKKRKV